MKFTSTIFPVVKNHRFKSLLSLRTHSSVSVAYQEDDYTARPRLQALRQQLESERLRQEASPPSSLRSKAAPAPSTVPTSPKSLQEQTTDLGQLLAQIDAMPLPEMPLQDRFGRQHSYLRISLTEKCNLRCLYCMPEDGVPTQPASHLLSNDEIIQLASWFVANGVDKVRLTGGEPLLRKDLVELVSRLNALGLKQIGITTNGVTLSKHLPALVEAGLTHVNISLDSLQPGKFARLTRRPPAYFDRVMQSIEDCARLLPHQTKINCVVLPDNVNELQEFCELTRQFPMDVRFIEYMPFNDNQWQTGGFVSYQQMQDQVQGLERLVDGPNDTTKWWGLEEKDNSKSMGRIGFITSMSEHFCGTCNRLRITADGQLKVCLFGKTEVSLRDILRRGEKEETLQKIIHMAVQRKNFKLGGHKDMEDLQAHSTENRPMTLIGG
eukprot:Nitzschia sp. Nitz4//scaffold28_size193895//188004//189317//NITZ4_001694-RA/size193895-processed-gene-0.241-mRNA-1//1//CDS//3329546069//6326//frame0